MSFDPIHLWNTMTPIAQGVVVLLLIMSIYSLTVAFERFLYYRKARMEGVIILEAIITADGNVEDVRVLKSVNPLLDASAVRAVQQWKYKPATLNGRSVRVYLTVTVTFRLN